MPRRDFTYKQYYDAVKRNGFKMHGALHLTDIKTNVTFIYVRRPKNGPLNRRLTLAKAIKDRDAN